MAKTAFDPATAERSEASSSISPFSIVNAPSTEGTAYASHLNHLYPGLFQRHSRRFADIPSDTAKSVYIENIGALKEIMK